MSQARETAKSRLTNTIHRSRLTHLFSLEEASKGIASHDIATISPCPTCIQPPCVGRAFAEIVQVVLLENAISAPAIRTRSDHDARVRRVIDLISGDCDTAATPCDSGSDRAAYASERMNGVVADI